MLPIIDEKIVTFNKNVLVVGFAEPPQPCGCFRRWPLPGRAHQAEELSRLGVVA